MSCLSPLLYSYLYSQAFYSYLFSLPTYFLFYPTNFALSYF
jgi:hypothetical protein